MNINNPPPSPPTPGWTPPAKPQPGIRQLPITLPASLSVAVLSVPSPMSEADYGFLLSTITAMKDSITAKPDGAK